MKKKDEKIEEKHYKEEKPKKEEKEEKEGKLEKSRNYFFHS